MSGAFVLVGRFYSLGESDGAKALLESAGLHPLTNGESAAYMRPNLVAAGGIQLSVPAAEAARARDILKRQQGPELVELNYDLRVRRAKLTGVLALLASCLSGAVTGLLAHDLQFGVTGGLIALFIWYAFLGQFLIPKAELKRK